ncbi:SPFH domain-containing protein [Streptomyces sp. NBC_01506]|uniref:SPFH domain-containing protein n=1 Tax=Streptomyces sp. NBC_01506 TaxID=2903887 RepID=UPI00386E1A6D
MTTQTSQPNGDGQMLRGAPALRAAARNALTARGPADPAGPGASTGPEVPAEPRPAEPPGWNEAGWHQNVRLLKEPPPAPESELEPVHEEEPEPAFGPGPEACYGGPVPEAADVVEWASEPELVSVELPVATGAALLKSGDVDPQTRPERELESAPVVTARAEPGSAAGDVRESVPAGTGTAKPAAYAGAEPGEALEAVRTGTGASAPAGYAGREPVVEPEAGAASETAAVSTTYAGPQTRPEREPAGDVLESVRTGGGAHGEPEPVPEAADVPHSRGESWALLTRGVTEPAAEAVDGPSAPGTEPAEPAENDPRVHDVAVVATTATDTTVTSHDAPATDTAPSGIPAPVWNVSVRAGSGDAVPTRAALTFDSHRWSSPLIVGEATHEIPVHLLFRDDETTGPVVAARPRARRAPVVLAPASVSRPATPVDTKLVERPGPTLPGWTAALVGVGGLFACLVVLWWVGAVPETLTEMFGLDSNPYSGIGIGMWALLTAAVTLTLFAFGGLGRGRVGHAWVLTLFGEYRGSVRRTGLLWVSPLLLRRRVDVRLRHWRSEPMPAVDANGTALRVVVLVVWRVRDTVRAALGVRDHEEYLREQVEAAMARVLSQLPADAFHEAAPTLRNAEVVGEALTRMLSAECRPVGLDVFSAQPTRIEYAPEISAAMQRSRIAAIDARHRDTVLTSVVDAVDDTVHRLTSRGLVELDDYERKALVKDLTVAFYTGRHGLNEGN